jgi:dihydroxyacid dehydratase/phosphogluconate dehydratase
MSDEQRTARRSELWFNDPDEPGETSIYIERYTTWGMTREEMQSGKPVIGIAQSGSELTPCNRIHLSLAARVKDGIRDAGGIPFEFPMHPIQESCRRPPRVWTGTSPIWDWWRFWWGIRSMAWC